MWIKKGDCRACGKRKGLKKSDNTILAHYNKEGKCEGSNGAGKNVKREWVEK